MGAMIEFERFLVFYLPILHLLGAFAVNHFQQCANVSAPPDLTGPFIGLASTRRSIALVTFNENNSSPCLVAAGLMIPCNNGFADLPPIGPGLIYVNPTPNNCLCSTVVYSLMAACAACQGFESGIVNWAYVNVVTLDEWDSSAALFIHYLGVTDSTAVASATGTSGLASATGTHGIVSVTGVIAPTGTVTSDGTSASTGAPSKTCNTGTIAGGVVGGVVGLALVVAGAYILMKRHNTTSSASRGNAEKHLAASTSSSGFPSLTVATPTEPQRLYDSSDPSTFPNTYALSPPHTPATVLSGGVATNNHSQNSRSSLTSAKPSRHYNGVAEL
ncbi:hypothetical protein BU17DRAFT_64645 [Hysterangium stoloniferum]|nr:hypothetical protein BU17DRAFT_64645 [Hysterangium stoloniferum]